MRYDAIILGGGFYGVVVAEYLVRRRGLRDVLLVEREPALLTRASMVNQARVHNGYHYPRSFTTAYRSHQNFSRFVQTWPDCLARNFTKIYAIARHNSKITAKQFTRFCASIGAPVERANDEHRACFECAMVDDVFLVEECAFDAAKLALWATATLKACSIETFFDTTAIRIERLDEDGLSVTLDRSGHTTIAKTRLCFNCTYSDLAQFFDASFASRWKLKHEWTEMALVTPPSELDGLGVTVMDGPFFSLMPFPSTGNYTLSHVRYTPHREWSARTRTETSPHRPPPPVTSRFDRMVRDASRFMPALVHTAHVRSLYEIKTVLEKNETDDGRPILFEKHTSLPGCYSILGGKIDNVFDVLEKLDHEEF